VYGSVVLASTQLFFDQRLEHPGDVAMFERLEPLGERAFALHDQPDAGLWEFRGRAHVHTYSSVMCWAACDRLARIAAHLGLAPRAQYWRTRAATMHAAIIDRAWDAELGHFVESAEGRRLDASLLLIPGTGFLPWDDPRVRSTIAAIQRELTVDGLVMRYHTHSSVDALPPGEGVFLACSFWLADALYMQGQREEAHALFERLLALRSDLGLLAEEYDPVACRQLGNFPQAFSHVALINTAINLSQLNKPMEQRAEDKAA
jgi:GH15 family glucan-1,4-alpha-glucosidase